MARQPGQIRRYTDPELALVKSLFADNEDLLFMLRKHFLQFSLTEQEEVRLKGALNESTIALLYKAFLPQIDPDSPFYQLTELHISLNADLGKGPDDSWPYIRAKELEIAYLAQQMLALKDPESPQPLKLAHLIDNKLTKTNREDIWVNLTAWNFLLSFIDTHLNELKLLAGKKEETTEETMERLQRNSNK